ncbi:MAG: MerR family transcriptional regulator [Acidimicrobiia bacterium]
MAETKQASIGEVINLLRGEFPEITVSKIRFLEGQGLIQPPRSRSGYRKFGEEEIKRIQYILRQQRDHFLPLKVIKSRLTAWERGEEPTVTPPSGPPPEAYFSTTGVTMTADELATSAGVERALIDELLKHGVLEPALSDGEPSFRDEDLIICRAAHRLILHGLEARHLRRIRLAANRETDLFVQLTGALLRHRSPDSRRRAAEILADCAQAARELQNAMLRSQLRNRLEA